MYLEQESPCPTCGQKALFSIKRANYYCVKCKLSFDAPVGSKKTKGKVFLSYGHDPACDELVLRIREDLRAYGYDVWIDIERIEFGDDWRREITVGINESQHVLAFLSKHSTRKPGVCRQEIAIAMGPLRGHVYTVLVEPESEVSPPLLVSHLQWLDMQDWRQRRHGDSDAFEAWYNQKLAEILRVLECHQPFSGELAELHRWLEPMDCTNDMITSEEGFVGREWLLGGVEQMSLVGGGGDVDESDRPELVGEIEQWRRGLAADKKVFWLTGAPGSGKSAVVARLAHAGRSRVIAAHFCKHDRPERRDAGKVVRSIAYQVAARLSDFRSLLIRTARSGVDLNQKNAEELFDLLLANPLRQDLGGGRSANDRHVIAIDALDECLDTNGGSELLDLIANDFAKLPDWIGLLVSSRPEAPVVRKLSKFGVHEISAEDERNQSDIHDWLNGWLKSHSQLDAAERSIALSEVGRAAAGNFLYVRQLTDAVRRGIYPITDLLTADKLPSDLDGMYLQWFERSWGTRSTEYGDKIRPLFELLVAAKGPLPIRTAQRVLGWSVYDKASILEALGSLCVNSDDQLSFFHKSLHDWIVDYSLASPRWVVSSDEGHERLAQSLYEHFLENWVNGSAPTFEGDGAIARSDDDALRYLCQYLPEHLRLRDKGEQLKTVLTHFGFAIFRCANGAHESLLSDYRYALPQEKARTALRDWAEGITTGSHWSRRASNEWPAHKILLQIAMEHADDSNLTLSAEQWLKEGHCNWVWLRNRRRPEKLRVTNFSSLIQLPNSKDRLIFFVNGVSGPRAICVGDSAVRVSDLSSTGLKGLAIDGPNLPSFSGMELKPIQTGIPIHGDLWVMYGARALHVWSLKEKKLIRKIPINFKIDGAVSIDQRRLILWSNEKGKKYISRLKERANLLGQNQLARELRLESMGMAFKNTDQFEGFSTMQVLDLETGHMSLEMHGSLEPISNLVVLSDSRVMSLAGKNNESSLVWNIETGELACDIRTALDAIFEYVDNTLVAWSSVNGLQRICIESGNVLWRLPSEKSEKWVSQPLISGSVSVLAGDCLLRIVNLSNGDVRSSISAPAQFVGSGCCVLSDNSILWWGGVKRCNPLVMAIDVATGEVLWQTTVAAIDRVEVLDKGYIVAGSNGGNLELLNSGTGEKVGRLVGHRGKITHLFATDKREILAVSEDMAVRVWSIPALTLPQVDESVTSNLIGSRVLKGDKIIAWYDDHSFIIYSRTASDAIGPIQAHDGPIAGVVDCDGDNFVSWSTDGLIKVWSASTGALIRQLEVRGGLILGVHVLPDGRICSWGPNVFNICDIASGKLAGLGSERQIFKHIQPDFSNVIVVGSVFVYWRAGRPAFAKRTESQELVEGEFPEGELFAWDFETRRSVIPPASRYSKIAGAACCGKDRALAWATTGEVYGWNVKTGEMLFVNEVEGIDEILGGLNPTAGIFQLDEDTVLAWKKTVGKKAACRGININTGQESAELGWSMAEFGGSPIDSVTRLDDARVIVFCQHPYPPAIFDQHKQKFVIDSFKPRKSVIGARLVVENRLLTWSLDGSMHLWSLDWDAGTAILDSTLTAEWFEQSELDTCWQELLCDARNVTGFGRYRAGIANNRISLMAVGSTERARWQFDGSAELIALGADGTVFTKVDDQLVLLQYFDGANPCSFGVAH